LVALGTAALEAAGSVGTRSLTVVGALNTLIHIIAGSAVGGEGEAGSAAAGETPVSVSAGVSTTVDVLCTFVYIWGGSKSGYRHFSTPAVKQHRSGVVPIYQRISETSSKALYLHTQLLGTPGNSDHSPRQLRPSLLSL
jgi:hypothetical protein